MKRHLLLFALLLLTAAMATGQSDTTYLIRAYADPVGSGTIAGDSIYYHENDTATLKATPLGGFEFVNWTRKGHAESLSNDTIYKFLVEDTATYIAHFSPIQQPTYNVGIDDIEHAIISADPNQNVNAGQTVTVSFSNIDPYYELQEGSLKYRTPTGEEVLIDNNLFDMPESDVTVTAQFVKKKHRIQLAPGISNGEIEVTPSGEVEVETQILVTATPDNTYETDSIYYYNTNDVNDIHIIENGVFHMPDYAITVSGSFSKRKHRITVEGTENGTVTVEPTEASEGETIHIYATPDPNYFLSSLDATYSFWGQQQHITINPDNTFTMVNDDVTVTAQFARIIANIGTPEAICAGQPLDLETPTVEGNHISQGWEMSDDGFNEIIEPYSIGQSLDASYNHWQLRYKASFGPNDVAYSNTVTITVNSLPDLTLEGEQNINLSQSGESSYYVSGIEAGLPWYEYQWFVTDSLAAIQPNHETCTIVWQTIGTHQVSVLVTDTRYGCTDSISMDVSVASCLNAPEIQEIVPKKNASGRVYILIYPNPVAGCKFQWYKDDETIAGATGQYYYSGNSLSEGTYKVKLILGEDCEVFSETVEITSSNNIVLYPNPSHSGDGVTVVKESDGEALLALYSIDGRLLHSQTLTNKQTSIGIQLPQGIYMVRITDTTGCNKVEKLVIQ